jgi:hypothetical protein
LDKHESREINSLEQSSLICLPQPKERLYKRDVRSSQEQGNGMGILSLFSLIPYLLMQFAACQFHRRLLRLISGLPLVRGGSPPVQRILQFYIMILLKPLSHLHLRFGRIFGNYNLQIAFDFFFGRSLGIFFQLLRGYSLLFQHINQILHVRFVSLSWILFGISSFTVTMQE